jgi:hypothetical protein
VNPASRISSCEDSTSYARAQDRSPARPQGRSREVPQQWLRQPEPTLLPLQVEAMEPIPPQRLQLRPAYPGQRPSVATSSVRAQIRPSVRQEAAPQEHSRATKPRKRSLAPSDLLP